MMPTRAATRPKILFLVSEYTYFRTHRLDLAASVSRNGFDVIVVTNFRGVTDVGVVPNVEFIDLDIQRSIKRPLHDLKTVLALRKIFERHRPDVVHNVSLKPVLLGSVAARFAKIPVIVNALTGLGYAYISKTISATLLRTMLWPVLYVLLRNQKSWTVLQNKDDLDVLSKLHLLATSRVIIIPGSGVDVDKYVPAPEPPGTPVVLLPARLLWDKGVGEFVQAARLLRQRGVKTRFVLAGDIDRENPNAIESDTLDSWIREGVVEWWGYQTNMYEIYRRVHVVCLPSYREGLPMALLEAAATGRPLVATAVAGCKDVVVDGVNGLLVPPRDADRLGSALLTLIENSRLRAAMGRESRRFAVTKFAADLVNAEFLSLYSKVVCVTDRG